MMLELHLAAPEDTCRLGWLLGRRLDSGAVVALKGDLGTGKTCLTQGLARGLDVPEDEPVVSPTFTLANEYQGRTSLFHLDLYRLSGDDFIDSGVDEYFIRDGVTVIEWAEKIEDDLPEPRLEVELTAVASGGRRVRLIGIGSGYDKILREISALI